MKIKDRREFTAKPRVLTMPPDTPLRDAIAEMCRRRFGSVVVTDPEEKLLGVFTERDVMTRVVNEGRDPEALRLADVMTTEVRVAREDDDLVDWLRIMSNERFRRLPIVDADGRVISMMTQGDFVSYTWPELVGRLSLSARAALGGPLALAVVAGAIAVYSLVLVFVVGMISG
ncbi:MAG: CBS domain-containing protein [Pseudomonadota bacterium]